MDVFNDSSIIGQIRIKSRNDLILKSITCVL